MASSLPLFGSIEFGSFLIYPARSGQNRSPAEESAKSFLLAVKQMRANPKLDPPELVDWSVTQLRDRLPGTPLEEFFRDRSCAVIAAPGAGLTLPHSASAPLGICQAMVRFGLAARMLPRVVRTTAVAKSAYARPGERTTIAEHYQSMIVKEPVMDAPNGIIVVDDIVTKGSTLLAAAARVREAYPHAKVRAFALARTAPLQQQHVNDAVVGQIYSMGSHARREP